MQDKFTVSVQEADFDADAEIARLAAGSDEIGAVASFIGYVRADKVHSAAAEKVVSMTLEHYPAMTEQALADIVTSAKGRWPLAAARVIHRVGRLVPGDRIVFVATASAHRGEAFAACEFIMDYLKTRAPFWKKEETPAGGRWVEARDSDDQATARWQEQ